MGFPPVGCIGLPQSAIAPSRDGIGVKLYHWDKQIGTLFPSVSPAGITYPLHIKELLLGSHVPLEQSAPTLKSSPSFVSTSASLLKPDFLSEHSCIFPGKGRKPWATPNKAKRHSTQTAYTYISNALLKCAIPRRDLKLRLPPIRHNHHPRTIIARESLPYQY
ncbi:hypothetical protein PCASD_23175 [Puccinia coronata f. sp. avenae]|uniref:Uncharacterized protein n=1 Tax=Puccinia coronata f. sp. avenae TaxID=200324 RepID=A0A2N5S729_9BASI|nr:hypothetical protein PCASD_23175 [Puccinia coronata f. sp. avenae]